MVSTLLQKLLFLLCCFTLYIAWLSSGWAAVLGPTILWSTPSIQKCTIETTLIESPSMPEIVYVYRSMMVQVECLQTLLFPKVLYRPTMRCRQVCRPSHISKTLGGVLFCCSTNFWYLHGSCSLLCVHFTLMQQVDPDQSGIHHLPELGWLDQLTLD